MPYPRGLQWCGWVQTNRATRAESLQRLQREDLLADYLARQQELAKKLGARPMTNEEFLGANGRVNVLDSDGASQGGS